MAHIGIRPALLITPLLLFTMIPDSQTNIIRSQPMEFDVEERNLLLTVCRGRVSSYVALLHHHTLQNLKYFVSQQPSAEEEPHSSKRVRDTQSTFSRDERDVQLDKPPLTLQMVENLDSIEETRKSANFQEERKDAASNGSGGSIPFLPTGNSEPNKEGGIPFLPGGSIPEIPGMQALEGQMTNVPKLVWGGFFFVETPMPGASLSNLASVMSMMQNGQQMVPSQLTGLMPQAPGAG